ncbi:MAG: FecR domain-containing protein, partial [Muribaculaceae bacterium]|nr:FecR domain-containing protein [Muribaculaceae bacterium]
DILYRHLAGRCSPEETEIISRWISESDANAGYIFGLEELYALGRRRWDVEFVRMQKAEKRFFSKIAPSRGVKVLKWVRNIAVVAASLVLCAGVAIAVYDFSAKDMVIVTTTSDEVTDVELPDGSHVWLNGSSELSYPKSLNDDNERNVTLKGEAYFEVAENPDRPFVVDGDGMTVRVLGTAFNFNCRNDGQVIKAALIRGMIEARCDDGGGLITLSPGQRAEFDRCSKRLKVTDDFVPLDAVWHNDLIPFDRATITEIADVLKKLYDVPIILGNNIDRSRTYSGVVKRCDSIQQVLRSLEHTIPFDFYIDDEGIKLYQTNN